MASGAVATAAVSFPKFHGVEKEAPVVLVFARSCRRSMHASPLFRLSFAQFRPLSTRFSTHFHDAATHALEETKAHQEIKETEDQEAPLSQQTLIWRAIKLPIYSVALIPLSVGAAAAYWKTGRFYSGRFGLFLGSAVLVIAWLNLSNDAYDAETGVDKGKKESVVNITGSREAVLVSAYGCLLLGALGLIWGAKQTQNMQILALLAGAITCGYIYQCPPFRLSYKGLGEPLCFMAFGPLATTAFYLSQGSGSIPITGTILGAATLVGITTTLILFCSHFHQIEGDSKVGKLSPLVRLGTEKAKEVVKVAVIGLYLLAGVLAATRLLPYPCALLAFLTIPIGRMVVNFVAKHHYNKEVIFLAKYYCVRLHVMFGCALFLGFWLAARMSTMPI